MRPPEESMPELDMRKEIRLFQSFRGTIGSWTFSRRESSPAVSTVSQTAFPGVCCVAGTKIIK